MKIVNGGANVSILGKELLVACPPEEREALQAAAAHLDRRMRDIHQSGKVIGTERCAIMAGLNLSHELLHAHKDSATTSGVSRRIATLCARIEGVLKEELSEEV